MMVKGKKLFLSLVVKSKLHLEIAKQPHAVTSSGLQTEFPPKKKKKKNLCRNSATKSTTIWAAYYSTL